jgi:tetratricopeptide (TPR) repeat protein
VEGLFQKALVHYHQQAYEQARVTLEIGRAKAREQNLKGLEADFLSAEGVLEWKLGNLSLASPKLEAALEIQRGREQWVNMASISNNLGIIAYSQKEFAGAARHYQQGIDWLGDHDNDRLRASLYSNLAEVLIPLGELDRAEANLQAALAIEKEANEPTSLAYTYYNLGELYAKRGDSPAAQGLFRQALELQESVEDEWAISLTRLKLGEELWSEVHSEAALEELEAGYELAKSLNALTLLRDYALLLKDVQMELGHTSQADFYANLHEDLVRRIAAEEPEKEFQFPRNGQPFEQNAPDESFRIFGLSGLQVAIILLLCLLISLLMLENSRLRKSSKDL